MGVYVYTDIYLYFSYTRLLSNILDWHARLVANDIQFAIGFIAAWFGALLKSVCLNLLIDVAVLSVASASLS